MTSTTGTTTIEPDCASHSTTVLDATGLGFRYGRGEWIFRDVDLQVEAGEVLAVLGPNARGKTTLVTCLAGLRKPTKGEVIRREVVGYVPQSHGAAAAFSVLNMVLMGRARFIRAYASPGPADHEAAAAALDRVGISHLRDRDYQALSGGERQLVLIARALATGCRALVLDEPASALDLRNQARVLGVLHALAEDGMAVVMTSHHPEHALRIADQTLLIVDAADIRVGATTELLTGATLSSLYGLPVATPEVSIGGLSQRVVVPDYGIRRRDAD
ncbi:ABC transporter ATP-binding protein [Actinomyces glycerinitolerans]|uniref:Abc transporter n=1 Tax=Actinomyces glycerinitolerans TaxID=1892869 RepID=A0A1M4S275_9ACTO|nr:ABC transporter ATP-binding protein [Actinomyces glycerinitolerans]SHE26240.1 abc transporter [Actinomyces glycerinitolerans]